MVKQSPRHHRDQVTSPQAEGLHLCEAQQRLHDLCLRARCLQRWAIAHKQPCSIGIVPALHASGEEYASRDKPIVALRTQVLSLQTYVSKCVITHTGGSRAG